MNFTQAMIFLFKHLHTVLLLLGLLFIVVAIGLLTNSFYALLALGVSCVLVAYLINQS